MADAVEVAEVTTTEQAQTGSSAETVNTDTNPQEHMIPKSRFDALNDELKQIKKLAATEAKQREATEAERLKEQGEYKTLYEKLATELEQERTARKVAEVAGLRRDVAARLQLPVGLVDRLRGDTAEDIEADARELLAALPKPAAPNINASDASAQGKPLPGGMTEESIREQAIRLRVPHEHYRAALLGK